MTTPVNPNSPFQPLRRQVEEAQEKVQAKVRATQAEVLAQIKEIMWEYEITLDQLVAHFGGTRTQKRKSGPVAKQYRDPVSGALWSGRGKEPLWIRGKDRQAFLIKP